MTIVYLINFIVSALFETVGSVPHLSSFLVLQMFCKSLRGEGVNWINADVYPLILFLCLLVAAAFPWSQRVGVWKSVLTILFSPFTDAKFRHTFLADVLTSLTKVTSDLTYTFCYFFTGACCAGRSLLM